MPLSDPPISGVSASDEPQPTTSTEGLHSSGPVSSPTRQPVFEAAPQAEAGLQRLTPANALLTVGLLVGLSAVALRINSAPPAPAATREAAAPQLFELPQAGEPVTPQGSTTPGTTPPLPGAAPAPGATTPPGQTPPAGQIPPSDPSAAAFEAAVALQKAGKTEQASAAYEELLKQKPELLPARLNLAILYTGNKQPAKALPHLQSAWKLDSKNAAVAFQLAQTLLQLQRAAEAEAPLKATVRLAPKNPQGWSLLGQVRLALKNPEGALAAFRQASDLAPKDAGAAFMAGAVALDNLNKGAAAEKYLRRAMALEKRDPRGPLYLARALASQRKLKEAEAVLEAGVRQFPKVPELSTTLAQVRSERGDRSGSIEALRAALRNTPESFAKGVPAGGLNAELGRQLAAAGRWKEAVDALRNAVRLLPREPEPSALLVQAALQAKNTPAAIQELRRVVKVDPKRPNARRTLARLLGQSGQLAEARAEYRAYLAAEPKDLGAVGEIAELEEKHKNGKAALALWQNAAKAVPDNPLPHLQVARLLEGTDRNAALQKYSYVLQIAPNDPNALWGAAKIEEKTKRNGAAIGHLRALIGAEPDFVPAYRPLLRVSEANGQLPATLNFLTQKLTRSPEHPAAYYIVLDYYREKDIEAGRAFVKNIIEKRPKARAPRRALDEFDLDIAKQKLEALRQATPAPAPTAKPTATPANAAPEAGKPEPEPEAADKVKAGESSP